MISNSLSSFPPLSFFPCKIDSGRKRKKSSGVVRLNNSLPTDGQDRNLNLEFTNEEKDNSSQQSFSKHSNNFTSFQDDPIVDKLRTQLGVIHPIPSPPINRNVIGLFVFFFFVGVVFDKIWTLRKRRRNKSDGEIRPGAWPQVPTSFSLFLEKDLQRKESVEWVNMVLGKLWKVYRAGIENWIIGLLQPIIDNLKKPDYVQRVEIMQFSLGDEPLSVRNVERRTSRGVNDLQYQIGLRYTGGGRMLLKLSLKFSVIPIVVPVGVRDFDIDGELWVKLRLIPSEPWVGAASWAFVSLPKIKFELSPFRLFNIMAIPVLSMFLTKLLTEDLPRLFVRPKKIVLDFQKGKAVGLVPKDVKTGELIEGNEDSVGELSVTLVDARNLSYIFSGKTDPYVILSLGDQLIRSKKNSQTTVIGPPGKPIWNQDFYMLVTSPRKQKLYIQVKDSLGFTDFTVGTGEVDIASLKDTVPTDRIVVLRGGWGLFGKGSAGEILLRLTYKAYVEDEEDEKAEEKYMDTDDELSDSDESDERNWRRNSSEADKELFMDVLAALLVSKEFQGIVSSETGKSYEDDKNVVSKVSNSKSRDLSLESSASIPSEESRGSPLVWLAVITSLALLISVNMGGSTLFNP
ncbi:synaptotagmin-2-like [Impatiens glandulifera]|uniref:synaptotagmin-2-like n=1 Tax=Impatiens glandulifera TaxID=253017 RepID=UPI001FB13744|nr:synaptotagmin-2-like [Impatiens glandulifera]XP_047330727.1 synaptotagmin-2-like [Impatiens glandulifera]XP_047330728.1 synaptotagmin-2-like [Impatiens glandulifera]XP_047330729.1 synaptotagmin-2-like [Impatiens glandulifera]